MNRDIAIMEGALTDHAHVVREIVNVSAPAITLEPAGHSARAELLRKKAAAMPGTRIVYRPHQGKQACERRLRQAGKAIARRTLIETLRALDCLDIHHDIFVFSAMEHARAA